MDKLLELSGILANEVVIDYTNWKGERRKRRVRPETIYFGSTQYHPMSQWLLKALDVETNEIRSFAMLNIHEWAQCD